MTYSIVAVDTRSAEVGGAGTSCLDGGDVFVIYRGVPGRGVVHAQARYDPSARDRAAQLLNQGQSARDTLAAVTLPSFDSNFALRQYGIVDVSGGAVGYTGSGTMPFADDRQGTIFGFAYSVQGNILTSASVLDQAAGAFESAGCDLAERLMRGLAAGANAGEGDSRCTVRGIPSDSAFLQVERPGVGEGGYLAMHVESSGTDNPLPSLQAKFEAWRAQHPCPQSTGAAGQGGETGEAGGTAIEAPAGPTTGCACQLTAEAGAAQAWLLFGSLLVVAVRRRAARQLRPALLAR